MIHIKISMMPEGSNIFTSQCGALVNPVNCVGVMGKGLALAFRKHYPLMFADYKLRCTPPSILEVGFPYIFTRSSRPDIINFPTKNHWRDKSKLKDIELGMKLLVYLATTWWDIKSLAIPALGCGEGGLLWGDVRSVIYEAIKPADDSAGRLKLVEVYEPWGVKI